VDVLVLGRAEVERLLDPSDLIDALELGFVRLSAGQVEAPPRNELAVPEGFLLCMPSHTPGMNLSVKIVNVFEGNLTRALPSHQALICLFDPETGTTLAVLDGTAITALRTAGAAAVSVRLLSRAGSRVATIAGAGVQGQAHLRLLPLVRPFDEILIYSKSQEDARLLAERHPSARAVTDLEEAVRSSDVVCLCTSAPEPVIRSGWVRPGTHVSSVGYAPPRGELDPALAAEQSLFVETRLAFAPTPVGCAELAGLDPASGTELGEVIQGRRPGRETAQEITVYKAMGHAMEDMVAADLVYRAARAAGAGTALDL
jgi:alanine dehydrogenase